MARHGKEVLQTLNYGYHKFCLPHHQTSIGVAILFGAAVQWIKILLQIFPVSLPALEYISMVVKF